MKAVLVLALVFALVPACVCTEPEKPPSASPPARHSGRVQMPNTKQNTIRLPANIRIPRVDLDARTNDQPDQ